MTRWLLAATAAGLLAAAAAWADEPPKEPVPPPKDAAQPNEPIPPPKDLTPPAAPALPPEACAPGCGRTICQPRYSLMEVQSATTLPRFNIREETIGTERGLAVDYVEERRTVTELVMKPHEVEQQVTCMTAQPCTVTDPCTGECHTEYHQVPVCKTVKITVFEAVPTPREVVVRVPYLKPGPEFVHKRLAVDAVTIPAIEKRLQLLTVPNEIAVPAPPPRRPRPRPRRRRARPPPAPRRRARRCDTAVSLQARSAGEGLDRNPSPALRGCNGAPSQWKNLIATATSDHSPRLAFIAFMMQITRAPMCSAMNSGPRRRRPTPNVKIVTGTPTTLRTIAAIITVMVKFIICLPW
jgi:hypothetical protein